MTKSQKKGSAFLLKTFDMLEKQEFKQIIDWISDGSGFVVKNPNQLAQKVLPIYFKHSNMHSFIRQLNMYGFNKKRGCKIQNYYFHHQFRKGQRQMICEIQRKVQKKGIHKEQKRQEPINGNNQQLSIQLQESQQNKQNQPQQNRRNNQIEELNLRKKIIEVSMANKILLMEQIYHLENLEETNLVKYQMEQTGDEENEQKKENKQQQEYKQIEKSNLSQRRLLLKRLQFIKQNYLKFQTMIWNRINTSIQTYENNHSTINLLNSTKPDQNSQQNKQTQLSIPKKQIEENLYEKQFIQKQKKEDQNLSIEIENQKEKDQEQEGADEMEV